MTLHFCENLIRGFSRAALAEFIRPDGESHSLQFFQLVLFKLLTENLELCSS